MPRQNTKQHRVFDVRDNGESVREAWVMTESLYCPKCGKQHVWQKDNGFNKNIAKLCINCGFYFSLADIATSGDFHKTEQRVRLIEFGAVSE